jgi:hypothetical protein
MPDSASPVARAVTNGLTTGRVHGTALKGVPTPTPDARPPGVLVFPIKSLALMLMLSPLAPLGVLPPKAPGAGVRTALPGVRGVRGVRVPGVRGLVPRRLGVSATGRSCGAVRNSGAIRCGRKLVFHTPNHTLRTTRGQREKPVNLFGFTAE